MSVGKLSDVKIYDEVFTQNEFMSIFKHLCSKRSWSFGARSTPPEGSENMEQDEMVYLNYSGVTQNTSPFWRMELTEEKYFNEYLFNRIREITDCDFDIEMIYANGATFGQSGEFHTDHEKGHTFLIYSNIHWDESWGGKTCFYDENKEFKYVIPVPNRAVFFPGTIYHYAESPTRKFNGLRMSVAYKLFKK